MLTRLFQSFSHLFYPVFCPGCGTDAVTAGQVICLNCLMQLPETGFFQMADNPTRHIFTGRLRLERAASMYYCTKSSALHQIIHQLKYKGQKNAGLFLGEMLGHAILSSGWIEGIDVLVPVPLHPHKEALRGYNQAALIAEGIASVVHLPVCNDALIRTSNTVTQTHKGRVDRSLSMEGKFRVRNTAALEGKHIVLVDDLITTGATLEFCGLEILRLKNTKLSILTVGKSIH